MLFCAALYLLCAPVGIGTAQTLTAERLRSYTVRSADGAGVGKLDDLLIDLERGRVSYLLVDADGRRKVYIPWRAVRVEAESPVIHLAVDADKFRRAPESPGGRIEDQAIHQFFGVQPHWEDQPASVPRPPRNLRIVK